MPDPDAKSRKGIFSVCFLLTIALLSFGYVSLMNPDQTLTPLYIGLCLTSAIGITYFLLYEFSLPRWKGYMNDLKPDIDFLTLSSKDNKKPLLRISRQARETSMLTMGTLFIPTAFVLLGAAATANTSALSRIALAASAPTLYVLWLFLVQLPTRLMDDVDSQMRSIVGDPANLVLHKFYGDRHGIQYMTRLRRNHWLVYVPLLILGATYVIRAILSSP